MRAMLTTLALFGPGLLGPAQEADTGAKRSPGVASVTYELEVDVTRARAVGWAASDASDAEAVEGALRAVKRRLDAMEREVALQGDPEHKTLELRMPQLQARERELFAEMLESLGLCEFLFVADEANVADVGIDLPMEEVRYMLWREQNPDAPLAVFHSDANAEAMAPSPRLVWVDVDFAGQGGPPLPLLLPDRPEDHLGAASLERAFSSVDAFGYPAIGIEFTEGRAPDLERITDAHTKERMAIVIEGRVRSCPTLNSKLVRSAIIEGRFKEEEITPLIADLKARSGPLTVLEIR